MQNPEVVEWAIETYDQLLWEAVARVCGSAFSQAFEKQGQSVRVVYATQKDPRECFKKIKEEVDSLIVKSLPIDKLGNKDRTMREVENLCSRIEYLDFFYTIKRLPRTWEIYFRQFDDDFPNQCDFVVIGSKSADYICCPCSGKHLANTSGLKQFKIKLELPKKVGQNKFEFRFEIQAK